MGRRKTKLSSKLIKTERYKILPSYWKEKGFKSEITQWVKTNKIIYVEPKKGSQLCGHGLSIVVKTYKIGNQEEYSKSMYFTCLCCSDKKEKEKFSIHLPAYSKINSCIEIGGAMEDVEVWKRVLLPLFGIKIKGAIKL